MGPIYRGGGRFPDEEPAKTYRSAAEEALKLGCKTLAFPCISTGVFGFPKERARPLVVAALEAYYPRISIIFCTWEDEDYRGYSVLRLGPKILGGL